jgi:hypothetical protein
MEIVRIWLSMTIMMAILFPPASQEQRIILKYLA